MALQFNGLFQIVISQKNQGIIRKIQLLGNGNWRARLCKQLDGLPRERDMKLYEAKLTKGGRILWELAIAFSPRCSEKSRLEAGNYMCRHKSGRELGN